MMNNKTYDTINFISHLIAPSIVFISAIINIWHIPYGTQITATLAAFDALVGAIVIIAKKMYEKNLEEKEGNE